MDDTVGAGISWANNLGRARRVFRFLFGLVPRVRSQHFNEF